MPIMVLCTACGQPTRFIWRAEWQLCIGCERAQRDQQRAATHAREDGYVIQEEP